MACRLINSPKTGQQIQSSFWEDLNTYTNNEQLADKIFSHTLSDGYVKKFGDWSANESILDVNVHGEPLLSQGNVKTFMNVKQDSLDLKSKLSAFIKNMGFSFEKIDSKLHPEYSSVSGVTDFLTQTVLVAEGADVSTLSQEAGHVYTAMIKETNPTLYNSIKNDIKKFKIYSEVVKEYSEAYNNDEELLIEEAIGQAIGELVIKKSQDDSKNNVNRINSWFSRVMNFLYTEIFKVNSEQLTSFLEASADNILNNEVEARLSPKNYKLFDIKPAIQEALKKLEAVDNELIKKEVKMDDGSIKEKYFYFDKMTKRISDTIEALSIKRYGRTMTEANNVKYEINRETGSLNHEQIQNIVINYVRKLENKEPLSYRSNLSPKQTLELESFVHNLLGKFNPASKIYSEVKVYNKKTNTAGTIDLLIVEPDGKFHIFDWKFIDSDKDGIDVFKKEMWNIQLNSYREALSEYGLKNPGMMRMIPISTVYSNGKFTGIQIDSKNVFKTAQPARNEYTGHKDLDKLLLKLYNEFNTLSNEPFKTAEREIKKRVILNSLTSAINQIQVEESLDLFIKNADLQLEEFEKQIDSDDVTFQMLHNIDEYTQYYSTLVSSGINNFTDKPQLIANLSIRSQVLQNSVKTKLEEYLNTKEVDVSHLGLNTLMDKFAVLSTIKNPIFRLFNSLKKDKEALIRKEMMEYNNELKELIDGVKIEEDSSDLFGRILQKIDGKLTGNLIVKYNSNFFKELKTGDLSWMKANLRLKENAKKEFDAELLVKIEEESKRSDAAVAKKNVEKWLYRNDFWSAEYSKYAYSNYKDSERGHRFIEPHDKWLSDEYKYLINNKDASISKLYFKFQNTLSEARKYSPELIRNNFIPSLEKSMIKKIIDFGGISAMKNNIIDSMTMMPYEKQKDIYGNPIYKIPLRYTNELKGEKSLDLGTVFSLFHHSVLQNKHLSEIESESLLLISALKLGTYYAKDWKGDDVVEDGQKRIIDVSESKEFVETENQLRMFINNSIYQVKDETEDFSVFGVSGIKMIGGIQEYFSMLNIGLNPFSAFANVTGGMAMLYSVGHKGRFFNKKQIAIANSLLATRNKTALSLTEYFDIDTSNTYFSKAKELSIDTISSKMSLDKMYFMQKGGEWYVQNSALIAFLQNHSIKEGVLIKKTDTNLSILESAKEVNGKIAIDGMDDVVFNLIREKVQAINNETLGSLSEDEILLAQKNLWWRMALQFKKWTLPMGKARFGNLTYNDNLEEFQEGKFKAVFSTFSGNALKSVRDIVLGTFSKPNQSLLEKIEEQFDKHMERNPEFIGKLTLEEYQDIYMQNLKSSMFDVLLFLAFAILISGLKDDDDDEEVSGGRRFLVNGLKRTYTELAFWMPTSLTGLVKGGVPLIGLMGRVEDVITNSVSELFGDSDKAKPVESLSKLVIGWNTYNSFVKNIEKLEK